MMNHAVRRAVYEAVRRAVYQAVSLTGGRGVSEAVGRAGNWVMHGVLYETGTQSEEPPHPGLELYLGGVA